MKTTALPLSLLASACVTSTHPTQPSSLGVPRSAAELLAVLDEPGPVRLETIASADWVVPRSGLLNLDHPHAIAAGLEDEEEPIQIYFHALTHPTRGTFLIDTGVERALRDDPARAVLRGFAADAMSVDRMEVHAPLGEWLASRGVRPAGVLLTHLHLDHILGLPDVPKGTPIFSGPGEASSRALLNAFVQGLSDEAFEGHAALEELAFAPDPDARFAGVLDLFGDRSVFAIWSPGHSPGHTAYLVRTVDGPVLVTGDACHTAWGWEHGVEPGSFSKDLELSRVSLDALQRLARERPSIDVRLGHQRRSPDAISVAPAMARP